VEEPDLDRDSAEVAALAVAVPRAVGLEEVLKVERLQKVCLKVLRLKAVALPVVALAAVQEEHPEEGSEVDLERGTAPWAFGE
jgi:hypothetical protein